VKKWEIVKIQTLKTITQMECLGVTAWSKPTKGGQAFLVQAGKLGVDQILKGEKE
jgi:hypothetical protein